MSQLSVEKIEKLILQIITESALYKNTSFHAQHCYFPLCRNFNLKEYNEPPYFLRAFCDEVKEYMLIENIILSDIIYYFESIAFKNTNYLWVSQCLLKHGLGIDDYSLLYGIATRKIEIDNGITFPYNMLAHSFTSYIIDDFPYDCTDFEQLIGEEQFEHAITDYKLTKLKEVQFKQDGFIFNGKYHLYNWFIDRNPFSNGGHIPAVFSLMEENLDFTNADFYMRLDARLSLPLSEFDGKIRVLMARYYGPSFTYSQTSLDKLKTYIVHGEPETGNKLLMVIKKDFDTTANAEFWHVELETFPLINSSHHKRVTTTFIHGKYYPKFKEFQHIDYIKNQYPIDKYEQKYIGSTTSDVPIDFYTTKECHYKIWCIENTSLSESFWRQIVSLSLPIKYGVLFNEMLEN